MRPDLLALNDDAIISLANRGLLKRSRKLIDRGKGPTLRVEDGVVIGDFEEGVQTALRPGVPLAETDCSCPAAGMCRHRIMVVLAFQAEAERSGAAPESSVDEAWDPGGFDDEAIEALLGKRALRRARFALSKGLVAEVVRGSRPNCRLPSTTVRFLVPHDLAYARCDCEAKTACAHVAHAVWAFREAKDSPGETVTIALTKGEEVDLSPLDAAVDLADEVLATGVVHLPNTLPQRFAAVKKGLSEARMVWPLGAVEELEDLVGAYRGRSARYTAEGVARAVLELRARRDACAVGSGIPGASILGTSVAPETRLDQLRLIAVGARVQAFEDTRRCEVFQVDPGSATVLVARREFLREGEATLNGPQLARKVITGRTRLKQLAVGQVLTQVARRRANRLVTIGAGKARTRVTPQTGDWSLIPAPIRVVDFQEFVKAWEVRPPRMLRPRVLAENVHVFRVVGSVTQVWSPARQTLTARVPVPNGALTVELAWRGVTPGAVAALSAALKTALWVGGDLRRETRGFVLRPLSIVCAHGVVVPDIEEVGEMDAPTGQLDEAVEAVGQAIEGSRQVLVEAAHSGLDALGPGWFKRLAKRAKTLDEVGMKATAHLGWKLAEASRTDAGRCALWCAAMTRLELAAELAGGSSAASTASTASRKTSRSMWFQTMRASSSTEASPTSSSRASWLS